MTASVEAVTRSIQTTNDCLADLTAELRRKDCEESRRKLYGYLHVLKGLLAAEEANAAHLAGQLPPPHDVLYETPRPGRPAGEARDRDASGGEGGEILAQGPAPVRAVSEVD